MQDALRSSGVVLALCLSLASRPTHAEVMDADGHEATPPSHPGAIFDNGTNLLWLDATETDGRSLADVSNKLGPGAEFDGWQLATRAQLRQLFVNAGLEITSTGETGGFVNDAGLQAKVKEFVAIYGQTDMDPGFFGSNLFGMNVWHADTHVDPINFAAQSTLWDDDDDQVVVGDNGLDPFNAGLAELDNGVALVMSLPEPSAALLHLSALGVLSALAVRRRRAL